MIFFVFGKFPLCNRFQLGNSFGNTLVFFLESSFYVNRFQLGNSFGNTYVFFLGWEVHCMYSFSIRQFICEY